MARRARELPEGLGTSFSVRDAQRAGLGPGRLRRADLDRPFSGVRVRIPGTDAAAEAPDPADPASDAFERQRLERCARAAAYAPRMRPGHLFSHETAAALWGGPLPLARDGGSPADGGTLPVHVSVVGDGPLPRLPGVARHRAQPRTTIPAVVDGFPVTSPESTWASLGSLPLFDLVALGDHLCRTWRAGVGRPFAGRAPLTTVTALRTAVAAGRRVGIGRLRQAVELIREDAWSPRESRVRCILVFAGLPEPELNIDVFDGHGRFLGCVDLAYPGAKIAIEYHGTLHSSRYADDVERIAALRAAGWTVIEVTSALLARPGTLVARVSRALAAP